MSKAFWWLIPAWILYVAAHHTGLGGIPGAEPLSAFFVIICLSWIFTDWLMDRLFKK